jgi:hypothetical protein
MPRCCFFDLFSVELLHTLFTYFLAHEILFSFSDVSAYVNAALLTYSTYQLNFKGIEKSTFDLICRRIQPDHVISLTISDDNETAAQSELFFSQFRIEQFMQLQFIKLIEIDFESLPSIFINFYKLKQLHSFSFDIESVIHRYYKWNHSYFYDSNQVNLLLINVYPRLLSQLDRLHLTSGTILKSIALLRLRHLKLENCSLNELETICLNAPRLKSLDIKSTNTTQSQN